MHQNILKNVMFLLLGLIIDAFGELRDQQEQVKEDMEVRFDTFCLTHSQYISIDDSCYL